MNESAILKLLVAVIAGGVATLVGKIIFDWLKTRGGDAAPVDASGLVPSKKCDDSHKELNTWKGGVDKCLVQHKAMIQSHETTIQTHEKRLDKGSDDFQKIRESIAGLNTSYAVLADRSHQRRSDDP